MNARYEVGTLSDPDGMATVYRLRDDSTGPQLRGVITLPAAADRVRVESAVRLPGWIGEISEEEQGAWITGAAESVMDARPEYWVPLGSRIGLPDPMHWREHGVEFTIEHDRDAGDLIVTTDLPMHMVDNHWIILAALHLVVEFGSGVYARLSGDRDEPPPDLATMDIYRAQENPFSNN